MRQLFLLVSILLLGMTWAAAQDTTPGSTSPSSGNGSMHSGQHSRAAAGGETSVTGCLNGSGGSYTLTDKHGMTYQLTGDTAKLSEHVGHEVKVTGTSSASSETGGAASSTAGAERTLQVTSLKHISKSCQGGAGGGMTH